MADSLSAAFDEALKLNTHHPRATFNRGLLRWRDGRDMDTQILTQLNEIRSPRADDWETAYAIGLVHLERLHAENAVKNLEAAQRLGGGLEVKAALEEARRILPDSLRCVQTFEGHTSFVRSVAISPDGRFCLSGSYDKTLRLWEFDWEYEFPGWADWDTGAQPYLEIFLALHRPHGDDGFPCIGQPTWTEEDFQALLIDLQHRGFGWLREEGVRTKLEQITANWQGPPPMSGTK